MGKRRLVIALALSLTVSAIAAQPAFAAPNIHNELDQVKEKKADAAEKAEALMEEIKEAEEKIDKKQEEGKKIQKKVDKLKDQIMETQKRIDRRDKLLKDRVRAMYKDGGAIEYLEVLFGSENFGDFVSRVLALNLIAEQDKNLLEKQKADKKKLQEAQKEIMKSLEKLQEQLDSLGEIKAELEKKKKKQLALVEELGEEESELKAKIQAMVEESPSGSSSDSGDSSSQSSNNGNATSSPIQTVAAGGSVQDIVAASRKYFGNSVYMMGGGRTQAQIRNGIFDCSGYVHWALAQIGVSVGWSTSSMQYAGHQVDPSNMQPGDLVFFDTYKNNGHVGIYIGGGKFIGSQSSTGVAIASMNNSYWRSHFDGYVRRVF